MRNLDLLAIILAMIIGLAVALGLVPASFAIRALGLAVVLIGVAYLA